MINQQGPGRTTVQVIHGAGDGAPPMNGQPQFVQPQPQPQLMQNQQKPGKQPKIGYKKKPNIVYYPVPVKMQRPQAPRPPPPPPPPQRPPPRPVFLAPPPPPPLLLNQ